MRYLVRAAMALSLFVPSMATSQDPGTVDVGFFGRHSMMDRSVSPDDAKSLGGRFGVFAKKNLAVELEYATGATENDPKTDLFPAYVRVAYFHTFPNKWQGIVGGGWVHDRTRPGQVGAAYNDDGVHLLIGGQRALGRRLALRMDAIMDYLPSPLGETAINDISNVNWHLQAGLTWRFAPVSGGTAALGSAPVPDSDRDGVSDAADACPNTAAGEYVDGRGCIPAKDSDNDGVFDANDRCPNTRAGLTVDGSGCPLDTDKDGVLDVDDRCPNTPAGVRVNATGCPLDSDGDGVDDAVDACADTPRGATVDARGCVPAAVAGAAAAAGAAGAAALVFDAVTFATGSAHLTRTASRTLDRTANALVASRESTFEVQGHTDNTGSPALNDRLSLHRANAVRDYLISKGVAANRLTAKGYSFTQPKASNDTEEGRAANRRVELKRTN